ncbi:tail fiber domain-containing protein [Emticicia sp. BO119]|uniref:tail fiber domain-containing protein n=1 Tax=Emticicia sp. BO119 TaxID=2757768 RepID=UPI0015F071A7|nr:tail fiber domain-containing protein [Emticicia sp. BO119]MBA4849439.1 tail fiber domain-containing protein [Emticicia sp. BO119]
MKTHLLIIYLLSLLSVQAQISSNGTDTLNIALTITPSGLHGQSNGLVDSTNVALGTNAHASNNDSYTRRNNTMLGIKALNKNISGNENLAMGNNVLLNPVKVNYNSIIGVGARSVNGDGDYVTSIGYSTITNSSKGENSAYGANAMRLGAGFENNAVVGANILFFNNNSNTSTLAGSNVLFNNVVGDNNSIIGAGAFYNATNASNNSTIGSQNFKIGSYVANGIALGAFALDSAAVSNVIGIGADALSGLKTGSPNIGIGYKALVNGGKSRNSIGIGVGTLLKSKDGEENVAIGVESLRSITTSKNNVAFGFQALYSHNGLGFVGFNVAVGHKALFSSINSDYLTAVGAMALQNSTTGIYNSALGFKALAANTTGGRNTAIGNKALGSNTSGAFNVAVGSEALFNNTSGNVNVAVGLAAIHSNNSGFYNVAIGDSALYMFAPITENHDNIALGKGAGYMLVSGDYNLFIGSFADASANSISNASAIGSETIVNTSNKVRIGNTSITAIEGQVPFSSVSDRRLKENILYTNRLGLNFILGLQSASYQYRSDNSHIVHDGFIAQDVEKLIKDLNLPFSGLKKAEDGTYSLAYTDFIIPLVNAKKTQQQKLDDLKKEIRELQKALVVLSERLMGAKDVKKEIDSLLLSEK